MTEPTDPSDTGEAMIGQVALMATDFVPVNWVACDGRLLDKGQYVALFSLIGNAFGGDGTTTFAVPDLRGAVPTHDPQKLGDGTRSAAAKDQPAVLLATGNIPAHGHVATFTGGDRDVNVTLPLNVRKKEGAVNPEGGGFLGIGGKDGAAATIYVPPGDTSSQVELDGGQTVLKFTPDGSVTVDAQIKAASTDKEPISSQKPFVIPSIRMTWCICVNGIYPKLES